MPEKNSSSLAPAGLRAFILLSAHKCVLLPLTNTREMLVGADRCLGDVVSEMLSTIEDSDDPHEEAHVYLVTLFPQFAHIFSELREVRREFFCPRRQAQPNACGDCMCSMNFLLQVCSPLEDFGTFIVLLIPSLFPRNSACGLERHVAHVPSRLGCKTLVRRGCGRRCSASRLGTFSALLLTRK